MMKKMCTVVFLVAATLMHANEEKQKRVYVDVVGDLFHAGHVSFFQKAKEKGDYLIVGVIADDLVMNYKRTPILTNQERVAVIESCKYVDEVIPNAPLGVDESLLDKYRIDVVVHGDDFDEDLIYEQYGPAIERGIFCTVPYTEGISTSDIIERIVDLSQYYPEKLAKKN
jgi:cytidyltransferase-like protein